MPIHLSDHVYSLIIFVCCLISLAVTICEIFMWAPFRSQKEKLAEAAAREFEGAKPALIHACDTAITHLPDTLPLADLEAKAQGLLTGLLVRLLASNPLLSPGAALLTALLPSVFATLPKTLDITAYKVRLQDEMHQLITNAKL